MPRGSVPRDPLGDMSLIDQLFKRVAIDLGRATAPASDKGHIYILTLVDYATRYPGAVPLKNVDSETVAETLLDMYSRVCQKKFFFEFPKSGFLICGNYRENNIAIDFRLLLPLVA